MDVNAATVAAAALATALATGLGALPFAFAHTVAARPLALASAAAAGCMLAASVSLVVEGREYGLARVGLGALVGGLFLAAARRGLRSRHDFHVGALAGADAARAVAIVAVMTAHSAAEGVGVGVSFGGGESLGVFITVAIALHNIPEGLAIALVLVPRGVGAARAALWGVFSSLPQPLLAVPAFESVETFLGLLPVGLGFAAGAMIWVVAADLIPDARAGASVRSVAVAILAAFIGLAAIQALLT
jgi:zinc transporter, ZIP family